LRRFKATPPNHERSPVLTTALFYFFQIKHSTLNFPEKSSRFQGHPPIVDGRIPTKDRARVRQHGRQQQVHRTIHGPETGHSFAQAIWYQGGL